MENTESFQKQFMPEKKRNYFIDVKENITV